MVEFSAAPFDMVEDLCGDPGAGLVVWLAGNQYMAFPDLVAGFLAEHPSVRSVFYETLPPGVLVEQLRSGGLRIGSLELRVRPDVLVLSPAALDQLHTEGLVGPARNYASNDLALLVAAGNPSGVSGWADLGRPDLRVAFPDPRTEGGHRPPRPRGDRGVRRAGVAGRDRAGQRSGRDGALDGHPPPSRSRLAGRRRRGRRRGVVDRGPPPSPPRRPVPGRDHPSTAQPSRRLRRRDGHRSRPPRGRRLVPRPPHRRGRPERVPGPRLRRARPDGAGTGERGDQLRTARLKTIGDRHG